MELGRLSPSEQLSGPWYAQPLGPKDAWRLAPPPFIYPGFPQGPQPRLRGKDAGVPTAWRAPSLGFFLPSFRGVSTSSFL